MTDPDLILQLADGRDLEIVLEGPETGPVLLFVDGTPSGAVPFPMLSEPAAARGLRTVSWSRPGYGRSTPQPGRRVADVVGDVEGILDRLGADTFVTLGWSGGGPHALACAALLPRRCLATALIGGVAPYDAAGLDWSDGMGTENLEEFGAATEGAEALDAFLAPARASMVSVTGEEVAAAFGDLVDAVDRAAVTGHYADWLAASTRQAVLVGTDGWRDDDLAFVADWGVDLASISRPVTIWQGEHDRMVPPDHGRWLADAIPGSRLRLDPDEGHLSLVHRAGEILDDLLDQATAAWGGSGPR